MNILFLAPHPFYQERGTPIAVDLLLRVLSDRGDRVDLVTFHEGEQRSYRNVTIHRIRNVKWVREIRPGFSWKKIVCDFFLLAAALRMAGQKKYQIVHAVEESAFIAILLRVFYRIPYIFDMDSSMPAQLMEQHPALALAAPVLRFFEAQVARRAFAVIAVCEALAETARKHGAQRVFVLPDISLLSLNDAVGAIQNIDVEHPCLMYIGNLEKYQGIELLLESFALLVRSVSQAYLAVIGGNPETIMQYEDKAVALGIAGQVKFFGPWPLASMAQLFARADILISPRIKGTNTPMKIYSYLQSGKPILATDLPTHTQALDRSVAMLAEPVPEKFAAAMLELLKNPSMGRQLAQRAFELAGEKYSFRAFCEKAGQIYGKIEKELRAAMQVSA